MPIKKIQIANAPARKVFRAPSVPEVLEVLQALNGIKPSDALEVSLSPETEKRYSRNRAGKPQVPAKMFVASIKRTFTAKGLPFTAYTPDGKVVIIVKEK